MNHEILNSQQFSIH